MKIYDFSQSIKSLNKENKFSEALIFFKSNKTLFTTQEISANKYLVYEMISALIGTNRYDMIFTFIEQYNVVLGPKDFGFLLKQIKKKPSVNWTAVDKFCDLISFDILDTQCKIIEIERQGKRKLMELASDKENWFAIKSKALFETEQYQECFELSKKALEIFDKFHYFNEIWFARRIALSKKHLGNSTDALNELLLVLKRKKEWFIQTEVAEIYKEKGDIENAFKYAIDAINNFGNLEYKVGLLVQIAEILELKQEHELAFKHYSLSKLLRKQEEWKVPPTIENALKILGFVNITINQLPSLIKELKNYWNSFNMDQQKTKKSSVNKDQILTGRVVKILHSDEKGTDGFIKYDSDKSVYFRLNPADDLINKLVIGLEVTFIILPPIDNKKKERAIKLKGKLKPHYS